MVEVRMKATAGISVAMCTYNGERYLREQLESILRQTMLPAEVVICDDGSSDATSDMVADFARSAPFAVRWIRNARNLGSTKNFEQAIGLCNGDLIALCDQDDVWNPAKLATLEAAFRDNAIGGVFSDGDVIDGSSKKTGRTLFGAFGFSPAMRSEWRARGAASILLRQSVVTGATLMFRANFRSAIFPISQKWIHDGWIAWVIGAVARLEFVEDALIDYRVHHTQQAGVPKPTRRERMAQALQEENERFLTMAHQFEDLRDHFAKITERAARDTEATIQAKIRHCYFRSRLPRNRAYRIPQVAVHLPGYLHYARGVREAVKDVLR